MEIATLPVQISAQALTPGEAADPNAAFPAQVGQGLPQDIFAALLAQQLSAAPDDTLVAVGDSDSADSESPAAGSDDSLQAELGLPALIASLTGAMPARDQQPVDAAQDAIIGTKAADITSVWRQPVAAASAAFAEVAAAPGDSPDPMLQGMNAADTQGTFANMLAAPQATARSAVAATAQAAAPAAGAIPQPVSSPVWGDALGDRVMWMVGQQQQGAELHLNPPSLGPLEIRLSMSDGQANLTFSTQHVPVREAIEAATPRLREMFGDSGINLGSVSVNVGSFSQQQPGDQAQAGRNTQPWAQDTRETDFSSMLPSAVTTLGRNNGMVDIFA